MKKKNNPELLKAEIAKLQVEYNDAIKVLVGMGLSRRRCKLCGHLCVVSGYICWNCFDDDSAVEEDEC